MAKNMMVFHIKRRGLIGSKKIKQYPATVQIRDNAGNCHKCTFTAAEALDRAVRKHPHQVYDLDFNRYVMEEWQEK